MQSTELGGRLSGLLERYQQYQDEVVSLHSWLSTQEQNQSIAKASGETDPQNLQNTLRQVQVKITIINMNKHKAKETADIFMEYESEIFPNHYIMLSFLDPCLGFKMRCKL